MTRQQLIAQIAERALSEWRRMSNLVADPDYLFDIEYDQSTASGSVLMLNQDDRAAFIAAVEALS